MEKYNTGSKDREALCPSAVGIKPYVKRVRP